ncbi:MAG: aminotransferase class I/II-fold pyridoxal phosphate-dependent enzyme [Bacillota bacterium]|nr:aminotransferase class I/II-fold pyridoxal phosphate-dependent enzyme [Bacillota bacterium]
MVEDTVIKSQDKPCVLENRVDLCHLYSQYTGIDKECIVAENGLDKLVQVIANTFIHKTDKIIMVSPDFSMYKVYTQINSTKLEQQHLVKDLHLASEDLLNKTREIEPKSIFVVCPEHPEDIVICKGELEKILSSCGCLVIVDEAYFESCGETLIKNVNKYNNLIILRTCSRFGYADIHTDFFIANEEIRNKLLKAKVSSNTELLTEKITADIVKNRTIIEENVSRLKFDRENLLHELQNMTGVKVYLAQSNFFLVEFENAEEVNKKLVSRDIKVKRYDEGDLKNCLKIFVGNSEENRILIEALKEC